MHFTGRTWRPPYEAYSVILQATSGCTYNKCKFCSLYKNEPFCMAPMNEFEEDLAEVKSYQPPARRALLTGANPFAMSYENLMLRACTIRDYLIKCQTIAMFARKLDDADIEYYFIYMTGLAGAGKGSRNAINSAKVINQLNPYFLGIDSLILFPDTELYQLAQEGKFVPAAEKERLEELAVLLEHLQIRVHLQADTKSNFLPLNGYIPREKVFFISKLRETADTVSEAEMIAYRKSLDSL